MANNVMFWRGKAGMEKAAAIEPNFKTIVIVGLLILALLGVAIFLYTRDLAQEARLVIDLAVAFFGWAAGRAQGEKAATTED